MNTKLNEKSKLLVAKFMHLKVLQKGILLLCNTCQLLCSVVMCSTPNSKISFCAAAAFVVVNNRPQVTN